MTLEIDSPCLLRLRPAVGDRPASFTLDILGGSLWFPFDSVPAGVQDGTYKSAEVEVVPRTVGGQVSRTLFAPLRLLAVRK